MLDLSRASVSSFLITHNIASARYVADNIIVTWAIDRCSRETPLLRQLRPAHEAACHVAT